MVGKCTLQGSIVAIAINAMPTYSLIYNIDTRRRLGKVFTRFFVMTSPKNITGIRVSKGLKYSSKAIRDWFKDRLLAKNFPAVCTKLRSFALKLKRLRTFICFYKHIF